MSRGCRNSQKRMCHMGGFGLHRHTQGENPFQYRVQDGSASSPRPRWAATVSCAGLVHTCCGARKARAPEDTMQSVLEFSAWPGSSLMCRSRYCWPDTFTSAFRPADILNSASGFTGRLAVLDVGIISPAASGAGADCVEAMRARKQGRMKGRTCGSGHRVPSDYFRLLRAASA
jgi:hypothetical protein